MERKTYTVPEFASLLGISRTFAYREAQAHGAIAGVPLIRVGTRQFVPRAVADKVLAGEAVGAGPGEPA